MGPLSVIVLAVLLVVIALMVVALSRARRGADVARAQRDRTGQYIETVRTMLLGSDFDGRVFIANRMARDTLGVSESEIVGQLWFDRFPEPSRRTELLQSLRDFVAHPDSFEVAEYPVIDAQGNKRILRWHRSLAQDESGEVVGVLSAGEDVTELRRVNSRLRFESLLLDQAHDSIIIHDADGHILYANSFASDVRGMTHDQLVRCDYASLLRPDETGGEARHSEGPRGAASETVDAGFVGADGREIPFEVRSKAIDYDGKQVILSVGRDISERRRADRAIRRLAYHDVLTGLANRQRFEDRMHADLVSARRTGKRVAVMFLDLDGFKEVNDTRGHAAGDEILRQVAHRLESRISSSDTAGRFGGDEFTILLGDVDGDDAARDVAVGVLAAFDEPFLIGGETISVGVSIGLATGGRETADDGELLSRADSALYDSKAAGRGSLSIWRPGGEPRSGRRPEVAEGALPR